MPNYKITGPRGGVIVKRSTPARLKTILPALVGRFKKVTVQTAANPPIKKPPKHTPVPVRAQLVAWAHWGIAHRGQFIYTMKSPGRSDMFHRKPGDASSPIYADCSQFYASICRWCGIKTVDDKDFTGTLLKKGKLVKTPKPGDCAIFGPGDGDHAAMVTEKATGGDWWTIGFGHQGAPDRVLLSVMRDYFNKHGEPGVRFLAFTP